MFSFGMITNVGRLNAFYILPKVVQCKFCLHVFVRFCINADEGMRAVAWFPYPWA